MSSRRPDPLFRVSECPPKKTRTVSFRLAEEEKKVLSAYCAARSLSQTDTIRKALGLLLAEEVNDGH